MTAYQVTVFVVGHAQHLREASGPRLPRWCLIVATRNATWASARRFCSMVNIGVLLFVAQAVDEGAEFRDDLGRRVLRQVNRDPLPPPLLPFAISQAAHRSPGESCAASSMQAFSAGVSALSAAGGHRLQRLRR